MLTLLTRPEASTRKVTSALRGSRSRHLSNIGKHVGYHHPRGARRLPPDVARGGAAAAPAGPCPLAGAAPAAAVAPAPAAPDRRPVVGAHVERRPRLRRLARRRGRGPAGGRQQEVPLALVAGRRRQVVRRWSRRPRQYEGGCSFVAGRHGSRVVAERAHGPLELLRAGRLVVGSRRRRRGRAAARAAGAATPAPRARPPRARAATPAAPQAAASPASRRQEPAVSTARRPRRTRRAGEAPRAAPAQRGRSQAAGQSGCRTWLP